MNEVCSLSYEPKFIANPAEVLERLTEELPLRLHEVVISGKPAVQPRLVSWHGPGSFTYSGLTLEPLPWTADLVAIRDQLKEHTKIDFNSVLANYYRDEHDSVGWHADDEHYFGDDPVIATISLGAARIFCLKRKYGGGRTERHVLASGSLFIMGSGVQQNWLHSIPKSEVPMGPRLSLTYRVYGAKP